MSNPYQNTFQIFSPAEIESLRKGGKILHDTLELVAKMVQPGIETIELDKAAEGFIREHGAEPGFKGYHGFPATLCTSINDVCVHGIPKREELRDGDIVAIDCGVLYGGLYTDACISVPVGQIAPDTEKLLAATKEALAAGLDVVQEGAYTGDISSAIHETLLKHGFDAMRQLTGHGLGATLHQFPEIPNFGEPGSGPVLPANTIIAIEPISTAGSVHIKEDPDKWTLRTGDGALSGHYEHTVLVTADGCEILTC